MNMTRHSTSDTRQPELRIRHSPLVTRHSSLVILHCAFCIATFAFTAFAETPAYYVEWIQTSGTQYINTGVNGKAGIQAEVDFQFTAMANGVVVLGSSAGSDATAFEPFRLAPSKQYPSYRYGATNVSYAGTTALTANTRMLLHASFKAGEQLITRDGAPYGTAGTSATDLADNGYPMFLGASNKKGGRDTASSIRVFSLKIWDASSVTATNLVRDFRPCVDENGAIGMHDLVSGDIFRNAGTDVFTCGARWNDDTQAYDLYRVTLSAGSGGGVSAAPPDEFLPAGTALTISATPDAGQAFRKWTGDISGSKYTAIQTFASLSENITLSASFTADVDAPIRRYVAPTAVGTKDGTSWANATADLAAAYEQVGVNPQGGEVWMKEGAYLRSGTIELLPNVRLLGGFAGDETDAAQADPAAHETLLHGSNNTYYWCTNTSANSTGVAIVQNGRVNMPPIERCAPEAFFLSNGNYCNAFGFSKASGIATNSSIDGLTLAVAGGSVVSATTPNGGAEGFRLRNCRVIACGYAQGSSASPVLFSESNTVIEDCVFIGNRQSVRFESTARTTTNVVLRTRFLYNRHCDYSKSASSACIGSNGKASVVVDGCTFERNAASLNYYGPSTAINLASETAAGLFVSNSVFCGNQSRQNSTGGVQFSSKGGRAEIFDCSFVGNTNILSKPGHGYSPCLGMNANGDLLVRNCYFDRNHSDVAESTVSCGAVFANGNSLHRSIAFVNCTIERNYSKGGASSTGIGTFSEYRCSGIMLVNCLFDGNDAFAGTARAPDVMRLSANWGNNNRLAVVNTIFRHSASDYIPISYAQTYFFANSYLQGRDLSSATTSGTGFLGDILTGLASDPGLRPDYAATAGGTPARGLANDSPLRGKARGVWLGSDGFPYCQDGSGNWRQLKNPGDGKTAFPTLTAAQATALGLDASAPVIPDATGRARFHKPSPGPLDFAEHHTRIILQ